MKTKILLCALFIASPLFADVATVILEGASVIYEETRVVGEALAIVGDVNVTANAISFDKQKNVLKCEGTVTARTASSVVRSSDCTIELAAGEKQVVFSQRKGAPDERPANVPAEKWLPVGSNAGFVLNVRVAGPVPKTQPPPVTIPSDETVVATFYVKTRTGWQRARVENPTQFVPLSR